MNPQQDLHESTSTDGATCAVCIENYRVDEVVRILPCKHRFHKSCIDQGRPRISGLFGRIPSLCSCALPQLL